MVVKFNETKNNIIGNKAATLIFLKNNGFNVPDGIIVDIDTFDDFLINNNIKDKIEHLLSQLDKDNVGSISKQIEKLFYNSFFMDDLIKEINNNCNKNKKYAVRSSGLKEDLGNFSFAGQYSTFLNTELFDIPKKIIECYQSLYSTEILIYLISNNIPLDNLKMAVIIEEMIDSEISGIAFTVNPITGSDKEMLLEIAPGLGENIVSGKVNPERYMYNWFEDNYTYNENNGLLDKNC